MNHAARNGVIEIENLWIPLSDGCRLAARVWMPETANAAPVAAILEYLPYRKRDFMRRRDEPIHRYFAQAGFASLRVDIRGTGDSDGVIDDEYSRQELSDAIEVIDWIAKQKWCSGAVGMMGISWGGFNSLQVAALNPPALKAIIALCSSDDRYADDAHYMGGCLLNENMLWGSALMVYAALPPDPEIVGSAWREMWQRRLDALKPFPAIWMQHPWRDAYWRHGSVCENFNAIKCAVYAIGGWADAYSNAVPRLMANLTCPKKGLIGPWPHAFPHDAIPGPSIGFLQEAVRWWDQWLNGRETGIMDEPVLRVWMQDRVPPQPQYVDRPGRWIAEATWPSPRIEQWRLFLNKGSLSAEAEPPRDVSVSSPQTTGISSGAWCAFGVDGEMPRDQRHDDGSSVVFDTDPLASGLEFMGAPVLSLELCADRPVALVAARLSDIAPDGSALRVTYGLLNLSHRDGHATPHALVPGEWVRVRLQLNDFAHAFPAGHRLRLALSTGYWPIVWPAPESALLSVRTGASTLDLPVRPPSEGDATLRPFAPTTVVSAVAPKTHRRPPSRRLIEVELVSNEMIYASRRAGGDEPPLTRIEDIDLSLHHAFTREFRILEADPLSAETRSEQVVRLQRGDWAVRLECKTNLTSSKEAFHFSGEVNAFHSGDPVAKRDWSLAIPRQLL